MNHKKLQTLILQKCSYYIATVCNKQLSTYIICKSKICNIEKIAVIVCEHFWLYSILIDWNDIYTSFALCFIQVLVSNPDGEPARGGAQKDVRGVSSHVVRGQPQVQVQ